MPLRSLNLFFFLLIAAPCLAQHADQGTGTLKNEIWWLNWSGITVANGATKTFTTNDGLQITVTFSNANTREPVPTVMSSNYFGSMLYVLYNFSDPTILPSLYDGTEQTGVVRFSMSVTASRNGVNVPFYLVTADAEASWEGETTTFVTNGSPWQCITLFQNTSTLFTDPLTGCGAQTVSIANTFDGNYQGGQSPIIMTQAPASSPLDLDVTMDHAGTTGGMAVAFGILQSEDRGDLPASYGTAQHQLNYTITNGCSYPSPLPSMAQDTRLMIGSVPGDADPIQYDNDDSIGVDEEAISSFPVYDGSGSYTLSFPVANTTGSDAWLTGWFDYNRDGSFQPAEAVTVLVPNNATSATVTWPGLPPYLPQGKTNTTSYGFRFRLSSDRQATQQATGFARDGEVEDYLVPEQTLCTPVTAGDNATICRNTSATLHATGGNSDTWTASDPSFLATGASITVTPSTSTDYYLQSVVYGGCVTWDTISIIVHDIPVFAVTPADTSVCTNSPVTFLASGGDQYQWTSPTGEVLGTDSTLSVIAGANSEYQVYIQDQICHMASTLNTVVTIRPAPVLDITASNNIDCTLGQSTLNVTGGFRYLWQAAPGISNLYSPSPVVAPPVTTTYYVQGTDVYGCSSIDSITVRVNDSLDLSKYPVPSAFTPNNDGHNDCFGLKYWGNITSLRMSIFNRKGLRVFFTTDPDQCWDGTYNGIPQPAGGYAYEIQATTACGIGYRQGIVILVR